jgi:hypothetical protein
MPASVSVVELRDSHRVDLSDGTPFLDDALVYAVSGTGGLALTLHIGVDNGRPILNKLVIERWMNAQDKTYEGDEVTASAIHELPIEAIVRQAVSAIAHHAARNLGPQAQSAAAEAAAQSRTRRPLTDSLLHQVANIARANPYDRTKQVADQLYTSHRNATRWIGEAKRRGFLEIDSNEEDLS